MMDDGVYRIGKWRISRSHNHSIKEKQKEHGLESRLGAECDDDNGGKGLPYKRNVV